MPVVVVVELLDVFVVDCTFTVAVDAKLGIEDEKDKMATIRKICLKFFILHTSRLAEMSQIIVSWWYTQGGIMVKGKNKRLLWVDVMRVIAIFLVVLVHTSTLPANLPDIRISFFYLVSFTLVKVSVPLFIMLSGALLIGKQESISNFFSKRAVKVLVPWILWTCIYMAWNYNVHSYHPANFSQWKYFFELTFFSQLWFLPLIFSLYILTPILRLFVPQMTTTQRVYLMIIWFIFVSVIPYVHTGTTFPSASESGLVPVSLYYSGYFILGYFLTNMSLPKNLIRRSFGLILIGIALTFVELGLLKGQNIFDYFAPNIVVTSVGVFLLIYSYFLKLKTRKGPKEFIARVGNASMGIYIVHGLIAEILNSATPELSEVLKGIPLLHGYFYATVLFVASFFFVMLLKKIPGVRLLVP